jgi:hypothetical protein
MMSLSKSPNNHKFDQNKFDFPDIFDNIQKLFSLKNSFIQAK